MNQEGQGSGVFPSVGLKTLVLSYYVVTAALGER